MSFSIIILIQASLEKNLKSFSFLLHHRLIFILFLIVNSLRYVDNILAAFGKEQDSLFFLNF